MLVGQQFGPFTIDKELGSGAMGTVYRGRFTKTGQVMAVKVMAPGIGSTCAAATDRFEREIAILKQLSHPNIVRFYGAGKQHKSRYFAMEYVEGESLDQVMSRRGRMTWEEVVTLGRQLCGALQHAHEKGIIHRDLKPSNIMMLPDGTLKLTDFGIAKDTDLVALTATNCTVGTASYMSPEQCKGERNLTHKSDLYSLGVLFYELLTGEKPFKADNAMEMFLQHVQGTFERPSRRVLEIPVWLDTLVCQLLEKKPEQRPLDANMVATTLGTIQEKVEAQQSAGVDAVRRRMIDRTTHHKKAGEEDKEAAHLLLTGKARPKRKQAKKGLHQKVWFQATVLLLALAVAGFLLYLAFRPPSADKLYQQAKRVMQSGDVEKQEAAIESDGPIRKYLSYYKDRKDAQAQEVRAWHDQIEVEHNERLLEDYMRRERNKKFQRHPESKTQEDAFKAVKAEDEGDRARATELWQQIEKDASPSWQRVATNHLADLGSLDQIDKEFQRLREQIEDAGEDRTLPDPHQQKAFLAWRAQKFQLEDKRLARSLLLALKAETTGISGPARRWFLYAAANARRLEDAPKDNKKEVLEQGRMLLETTREKLKALQTRKKEALLLCLDLIALYDNDEEMKPLADDARKLRDEIVGG